MNYIDVPPTDENYWQIPCQGSTIQGQTVDIVSVLNISATQLTALDILWLSAPSCNRHRNDLDWYPQVRP